MKKLNRKGFTLIELLAVIVILAIVMGVAANSVLNVMNDSRKNTLQSSAQSAADAFRTAYAEYQLKNSGTILGINVTNLISTAKKSSALTNAASYLNISANNYELGSSYVQYDPDTSAFTVCLVAKKTGSYYLDTAKAAADIAATDSPVGQKLAKDTMWACSNGQHSWT